MMKSFASSQYLERQGLSLNNLNITIMLQIPGSVLCPCYLARRSLCEIINSTLGMLIHRWIGALYFAPASNSRVNRERQWCISVSALFANAFRNEAMSISSKINEMVCPLSNFESRLLCFLPICVKAFFSELTAGRIFPDLSAIIKSSFGFSFVL